MYELKETLNIWTTEGLTVAEPGNVIVQDQTGIIVAVDCVTAVELEQLSEASQESADITEEVTEA